MRSTAFAFSFALLACQRSPQSTGKLAETRHAAIARLDQCSVEDRQKLVMIASDHYAWRDDLDKATSEEAIAAVMGVRCDAAKALGRYATDWPPNWAGDIREAEAMHRPDLMLALHDLAASSADCGGYGLRRAAEDALPFPVPWLPGVYDRDFEQDVIARYDAFSPSPRSDQIDAIMNGTVEGAIRFLDLVTDYPWDTERARLGADQQRDLDRTVESSFHWIDQIALQPEPRGCEVSLQDAIVHGELGAKLVSLLDHPNKQVRRWTIAIFTNLARPGTEAKLRELAQNDPDAAYALKFYARGGRAHVDEREW